MGCRFPVGYIRVLFVVEWTAATYGWNDREVVVRRWGCCIPFQGKCIPGIVTGLFAITQADYQVDEEHHDGNTQYKGADGLQ